jgi:hypothetical protein
MPVLDVSQSGAGPWAFVAVQPAGSAGGVTPSKSWLNLVTSAGQEAVAASITSVAAVDVEPTFPPAAKSLVPIAAPAISERATFRLGPCAQLSVAGSYATVVVVWAEGVSPPKLQSLPLAAALPGTFVGVGMAVLAVQVFPAML